MSINRQIAIVIWPKLEAHVGIADTTALLVCCPCIQLTKRYSPYHVKDKINNLTVGSYIHTCSNIPCIVRGGAWWCFG